MQEQTRDTIPRLHRVVPHVRDQLRGIADGAATFEECRLRYAETQKRLAGRGEGRLTASPGGLGENERNWAPTRDCLAELMRWGALADKALPSGRKFLDRYRHERYELTDLGGELAGLAQGSDAPFVDRVTVELIAAHPYLRAILLALKDDPIICPAVSEGDIDRGHHEGRGASGWGHWAAERISGSASADEVSREIEAHLTRRFGTRPSERPTNKALAEATNDALAVAGFAARGIRVDATTIKTILRWGSELLIYDQSRYIPRFSGSNVIWLASDLNRAPDDTLRPVRRGLAKHGERVAHALVRAYQQQAVNSDSSLNEPYLPVHRVRSEAAFESRVMRALGDVVLSRVADGEYPEIEPTVLLHIGTSALPKSEPPFRHHNRRRLEVTMSSSIRKEQS